MVAAATFSPTDHSEAGLVRDLPMASDLLSAYPTNVQPGAWGSCKTPPLSEPAVRYGGPFITYGCRPCRAADLDS